MLTINYTLDSSIRNGMPTPFYAALKSEIMASVIATYPIAEFMMSEELLNGDDFQIAVSSDWMTQDQKYDTATCVYRITSHVISFGKWIEQHNDVINEKPIERTLRM